MKKVIFIMSIVLVSFTAQVKAQFITIDPAHIATSIINSLSEIVETSSTVTNVIKNYQEVKKVYDQGKEYYDKLKAINDLVKDARKVRDAILLVGEIGDIYIDSFEKMLSDPHFSLEEIVAIANGYTTLLKESANLLLEIKDVVNQNGLSMTDYERMDIINFVYDKLYNHKNLVRYYTNKNISISYLRSKKAGDTDRVISLYGTPSDRYW